MLMYIFYIWFVNDFVYTERKVIIEMNLNTIGWDGYENKKWWHENIFFISNIR